MISQLLVFLCFLFFSSSYFHLLNTSSGIILFFFFYFFYFEKGKASPLWEKVYKTISIINYFSRSTILYTANPIIKSYEHLKYVFIASRLIRSENCLIQFYVHLK